MEEGKSKGIGAYKKFTYFGSGDLGRSIQLEIEARAKEFGPGWTVSRLLLQCYRERMEALGMKTVVPDQEPGK